MSDIKRTLFAMWLALAGAGLVGAQGKPSLNSNGVTSAAGFSSGLTRGSVGTIFGTFLADGVTSASTVPLPRTLGNVEVAINGIKAPLWYTSPGQINFQVPFESTLQGPVALVVTRNGIASSIATVTLTPYAPSVFVYERATGLFDPIIVHASDNQLVTPTNPAVPGEFVVVYGTGIGDLTSLPPTGDVMPLQYLANASVLPTVTIGGANADVGFAGMTPGAIGLAQFNVQVPTLFPAGATQPVAIAFGQAASQPVPLYVAPSPPLPSGTIITLAGTGFVGFSGDNGAATTARLNGPFGVAADSAGNVYIADWNNQRVRRVDTNGIITTVAGTGVAGYNGDGIAAASAQLNGPTAVVVDSADNLYIVETGARVRKVDRNGVISTIAGTGVAGMSGDGGPATLAQLNYPEGACIDKSNNVYIIDTGNNAIRKVSPAGLMTTLLKSGFYTGFGNCAPSGAVGILVAMGSLIAFVGPSGGVSNVATTQNSRGLAVDAAGNIYFCEYGLSEVLEIAANGKTRVVAGTGTAGFGGDVGPAGEAQLRLPSAVAVDSAGNLYIADYQNQRIRKILH